MLQRVLPSFNFEVSKKEETQRSARKKMEGKAIPTLTARSQCIDWAKALWRHHAINTLIKTHDAVIQKLWHCVLAPINRSTEETIPLEAAAAAAAITFRSNEIREQKIGSDLLLNRYMIILLLDNKILSFVIIVVIYGCRIASKRTNHTFSFILCVVPNSNCRGLASFSSFRFLLSCFWIQPLYTRSFSSPFSHVILLLTRIYFLNRSVSQFAILLSVRISI